MKTAKRQREDLIPFLLLFRIVQPHKNDTGRMTMLEKIEAEEN